jgi:hypothetical protein
LQRFNTPFAIPEQLLNDGAFLFFKRNEKRSTGGFKILQTVTWGCVKIYRVLFLFLPGQNLRNPYFHFPTP